MTVPLTLVVNPAAGGGKPASYLPKVTAVLDAAGAGYTVSESTSLEHARTLAAQAAGRGDTVVAFGGDGLTSALAGTFAQAITGSTQRRAQTVAGQASAGQARRPNRPAPSASFPPGAATTSPAPCGYPSIRPPPPACSWTAGRSPST